MDEQTKDLKDKELLEKVAAIDEMTQSRGWKELMQVADTLYMQEMSSLRNQELDHNYYRKIGFLQMYKYVQEIPNLLKDKKIREYLLHQGRAKAVQSFVGLPLRFFEGMFTAKQQIQKLFEQSNQINLTKEKNEFNETHLK